MARSAPTACTEPGCNALVSKGTRCDAHKKQTARDYRASAVRKQLEAFYGSTLWRSISAAYRKRNPLCEHCTMDGKTTPADVCDHIIEIRDDWTQRHNPKNLMSLCHACHNSKTRSVATARAAQRRR